MKKNDKNKELLLELLRKNPIIQICTEKVGISRPTFYRWKKEDPVFAKAADEALLEGTLVMNDFAESQILTGIKNGNLTASIFWLKNKHPDYRQRVMESAFALARDHDDNLFFEVFGEWKPETKRLIEPYLSGPTDPDHGK